MATCKKCAKDKIKTGRIDKTSTGKVKYVYFDELGRQWWGSVCPDCHAEKARQDRFREPERKACAECGKSFSTLKPLQVVCGLRCREIRKNRQAKEKKFSNRIG